MVKNQGLIVVEVATLLIVYVSIIMGTLSLPKTSKLSNSLGRAGIKKVKSKR